MVHEDMDLVTELDGEDIAVQLHVSHHRRMIHVVSQLIRDLGGFLGDLLAIIGSAVESTEIEAVIEQASHLVDVIVPMGEQLGAKRSMFLNQKRDLANVLEARPLADIDSAKAFVIMQGPFLGNRFG